jgi:polysaccharide biosynthesis/export protein
LQQNDVVYVEPSKMKEIQANTNTRTFAIAGMIFPILTVLAWNINSWLR